MTFDFCSKFWSGKLENGMRFLGLQFRGDNEEYISVLETEFICYF